MKVRLILTKEHIMKGKAGSRSCPVVLSLKDRLDYFDWISAGHSSIYGLRNTATGFQSFKISPIPEPIKSFILNFDAFIHEREDMKKKKELFKKLIPFEYELELDIKENHNGA